MTIKGTHKYAVGPTPQMVTIRVNGQDRLVRETVPGTPGKPLAQRQAEQREHEREHGSTGARLDADQLYRLLQANPMTGSDHWVELGEVVILNLAGKVYTVPKDDFNYALDVFILDLDRVRQQLAGAREHGWEHRSI